MSRAINSTFVFVGLGALTAIGRTVRAKPGSSLAFLLICLATAFCVNAITTPAKRLHFFQYGPLSVLVFAAVGFRSSDRFRYIWTLAIVSLIGLGDELIQGALPSRRFAVVDIATNAMAGALTLAFIGFVIGEGSPVPQPGARSPESGVPRPASRVEPGRLPGGSGQPD